MFSGADDRFLENAAGTRLPIRIDAADWRQLGPNQKMVVRAVVRQSATDPTLDAAMKSYERLDVTEIWIRVGANGFYHTGQSYSFGTHTGMAVSTAYDSTVPDKTRLVAGKPIVISVNVNHWTFASDNQIGFATFLIHELLHPYVPDRQVADGVFDDHPDLVQGGIVARSRNNLFIPASKR